MEKKKKGNNKKKKQAKKPVYKTPWFVAIVAVIVVAAGFVIGMYSDLCRYEYNGDDDVRIYIPKGSTAEAVGDTLRLRLGEDFGGRVYKIWKLRKGEASAAAGSYVVSPGMMAMDLSHRILVHAETPVRVTYNNIRTLDQLASRVAKYMDFSADDFLAACDSVLPDMGFDKQNYTAAFLPDTYEFYWSAKPEHVVRTLVNARNKFWTPERKAVANSLGLTPEQVAVLASIVEEETIKDDERPKVARLYLNRLGKGMMLQADPTVKFALGDFSIRRITNKHLEVSSPYNTYKHKGLPPGPIRVVERKSLDAVLNAPMHPYLYMCAKEDFSGYHNFAVTADQHLSNARRYHQALNERNIR